MLLAINLKADCRFAPAYGGKCMDKTIPLYIFAFKFKEK